MKKATKKFVAILLAAVLVLSQAGMTALAAYDGGTSIGAGDSGLHGAYLTDATDSSGTYLTGADIASGIALASPAALAISPFAVPLPWAITNVASENNDVFRRFAVSMSYAGGVFELDTRGMNTNGDNGGGSFAGAADQVAFVSQAVPYDANFIISGNITVEELFDARSAPGFTGMQFANNQSGIGFMVRDAVGIGAPSNNAAYILAGIHLGTDASVGGAANHPTLNAANVGRMRVATGAAAAGQNTFPAVGAVSIGVPFPVSLTRAGNTFTISSNGVTHTINDFTGFTDINGGNVYIGMTSSRQTLATFTNVTVYAVASRKRNGCRPVAHFNNRASRMDARQPHACGYTELPHRAGAGRQVLPA